MKISKAELQKRVKQQTIKGQTIYYSYAEKSQATISILKNQRLLIFNSNTGMLYYINEPKQLPFKTEVPKPKNECANMNVSMAKNPPGTNEFNVQFAMRNEKGEQVMTEWQFVFQTKELAQQWIKVIQAYKNKKIQEMIDAEEKKKQQNAPKNQGEKVNRSFIHDTFGFGLLEVPKKKDSVKQPEVQPPKKPEDLGSSKKSIVQPPKPISDSNIKPSPSKPNQLSPSKPPEKKQPLAPQNKGSNTNIQGSNIQGSNIQGSNIQGSNIQGSNIKPINPTNPTNPTNPMLNSQTKPINPQPTVSPGPTNNFAQSILKASKFSNNKSVIDSPEIKRSKINDQTDPRMSKMTLKDQLESILERSQLRQSQFGNNLGQSQISQKSYNPQNDWNLKFLKKQNEEVLLDFQQYAVKAFQSILAQDKKSSQKVRCYLKNESMIIVAFARTIQAKKLKSQFRNYHFIMESCKDTFIVGVPLACLIQFQGVVALVQSLIPEQAPKVELTQEVLNQIRDLERYTRVKNSILKKAALYDLTDLYQFKQGRLIYINQLIEYLPMHVDENFYGGSLRPEHVLDNVNQLMQGGMAVEANRQDMKVLHETLDLIQKNVAILAKQLSTQTIVFTNGQQLKNIMHERGINLKYLSQLYSQVTNKTIKKYIHTFMVAKIAKDYILQTLAKQRLKNSSTPSKDVVEITLKYLIQGGNNQNNELWKEIALKYRKQYNVAMSNHDIAGPFFLNSLMKILPGVYDLTKLNDKKIFFREDGIINKGFVAELLPKIKTFYRYTTQLTDKIFYTCKQPKNQDNYKAMVEQFQLQSKPIPRQFNLSKTSQLLQTYLTHFACPSEFDPKSFSHLKLYQTVSQQPLTFQSLQITKNYLKWCMQKQQFNRFKQVVEQQMRIISYWLDSNHVYHCEFFELLADYCETTGATDQGIKLMKESIALCLKNGANSNTKTGQKYFSLAQKQLRAGRKKDSMENFTKAKNIMETQNDFSSNYPITLLKLSSLYLNSNEFQNCVIYAKTAVEKFEELENDKKSTVQKGTYDRYCIKAVEIMSRAFEIENKKAELYRVAQQCSTKYIKTHSPQVFQQLIKLCLTAVIFKHPVQKCALFQSLIQKLSISNKAESVSSQLCLNELMAMAQQSNIMEKFMFKFQSLERIVGDLNSRRALANDTKQFINVVKNIVEIVGEDFVIGLIRQKDYE